MPHVTAEELTIPEPLQRARELFEAAVAQQGSAREAFITTACNGDVKLRTLVEKMLAADSLECPVLDNPLNISVAAGVVLNPGDFIGPYRIVRELGSGGMGAVYQVEREGLSGPLALKLVRWFSPDNWQRFEQEKAILSALSHPNIARLVDAGSAADGSPYFVMEYVEGKPIHSYCEQLNSSVEKRIGLFRQVCAAVRYLHQNFIVHRDLKPSNILINDEGQVKLVDFGIAKLLERRGELTPTASTAAGIMTPDYASPEQVCGGHISALADVYSLGVLLFELLVGTNPFAVKDQNLHNLLRRICEEESPRPSTVATDARLSRKLRGELDNIILTALRKEPERRYASVEAFDEDLRRYQEGFPVVTQGDSLSYRARKFVGRYKVAVVAAIACLAILAGGIVATRREANIARQERARAEAHSIAAERARIVADEQRRAADTQRVRAEQFAAEAQRERANAERRLNQMGKLANNAVRLYTAATTTDGDTENSTGAMIAENARDSLLMLSREGMLGQQMAPLLASTAESLESYRLTGDGAWHVPAGWTAGEQIDGNYQVGLDNKIVHSGKSSLFLRSLVPDPKGRVTVTQRFSSQLFKGARVRLRVYLRAEKLSDDGGFCLSIVYANANVQCERVRVTGTFPWTRYEIVANVPTEAVNLQFDVYLAGPGTIWADDFVFEKVDSSVPLTRTNEPQNLNFIDPKNTIKEKHK